jgi:putative endonuclease
MERRGEKWKLGQLGEKLAAEFLINKGYELIDRNITVKQGEIDILMRDGSVIVLVEVKTQTTDVFRDPVYQIGPAKQRKLRLLGKVMILRYPQCNIRIDAITVVVNSAGSEPIITHLENVLE